MTIVSHVPYEDTIICTVDADLADTIGNDMGDDFIWAFETESEPPAVSHVTWGAIKAEY